MQDIFLFSIDMLRETYSSRKNPASARHSTVASFGSTCRKLSQCIRVANPPAEHPESKAYKSSLINHQMLTSFTSRLMHHNT